MGSKYLLWLVVVGPCGLTVVVVLLVLDLCGLTMVLGVVLLLLPFTGNVRYCCYCYLLKAIWKRCDIASK